MYKEKWLDGRFWKICRLATKSTKYRMNLVSTLSRPFGLFLITQQCSSIRWNEVQQNCQTIMGLTKSPLYIMTIENDDGLGLWSRRDLNPEPLGHHHPWNIIQFMFTSSLKHVCEVKPKQVFRLQQLYHFSSVEQQRNCNFKSIPTLFSSTKNLSNDNKS